MKFKSLFNFGKTEISPFLIHLIILSALLGMSSCSFFTKTNNCIDGFTELTYNDTDICVSSDYYMQDGIRMPLTYNEARLIADNSGMQLPTSDMVDFIYEQADCKLSPISMAPTSEMTTMGYFETHNHLIEEQLFHSDYETCNLIAGHKKDVLQNGKIYGWHREVNDPIQPESGIHGDNYRDYSHGIRFWYTQ